MADSSQLQNAVETANAEAAIASANAEAVKCEAEAAKAAAQAEVEVAAAGAVVEDISKSDISDDDFETWLQGRMEEWSARLLEGVNATQALTLESFKSVLMELKTLMLESRTQPLVVTAEPPASIQAEPEPVTVVMPEATPAASGSGESTGARKTSSRRRI